MQAAESLDAGGDRALPGRFLGDIQGHEQRCIAQVACERAAPGLVAVGQNRLAALAHDQPGALGADARRAAAHQHDLVRETGHGATFSSGPR